MTRARYFQWMAIFECFQGTRTDGRLRLESAGTLETLYGQLNEMWQEDRKTCTEFQLAAYGGAWASGDVDIEEDAQFQEFLRQMNRAFRDRQ